MICRKATVKDVAAIVDFQIEMARESEGIELSIETVRLGVARVFDDPRWGEYFVAEKNERVVASTLIQYEWSDWRNAVVWWIHSVYVIPEARRSGVFRALYQSIQAEALKRSDVKGFRLYVEKNNVAAQACYKELGLSSDRYELYEIMLSGR